MISLQSFINKTYGIYQNIPGATGTSLLGECVSLTQQYLSQCFGIGFKARGNAKDWINTLPREGIAKVVTTPQRGDIIVWGAYKRANGTTNQYGHIGIYIDENRYYDQFSGNPPAYRNSSAPKSAIIGYLRMNKALVSDFVGTPVVKDTTRDQVEVLKTDLNCRNGAGTKYNILGTINKGFYNVLSSSSANGYIWYQINQNEWIALVEGSSIFHMKEETPETDDKDKIITELKVQISELQVIINSNEQTIAELEKDLENVSKKHLFKALKKDYYYIHLEEDDTVLY